MNLPRFRLRSLLIAVALAGVVFTGTQLGTEGLDRPFTLFLLALLICFWLRP